MNQSVGLWHRAPYPLRDFQPATCQALTIEPTLRPKVRFIDRRSDSYQPRATPWVHQVGPKRSAESASHYPVQTIALQSHTYRSSKGRLYFRSNSRYSSWNDLVL